MPLPAVQYEVLPGRQVQVSWSCEGADRYGICWGPQGMAPCFSAGTATDTLLVAWEDDLEYWLDVSAYKEDLGGQAASSSRFYTVEFSGN